MCGSGRCGSRTLERTFELRSSGRGAEVEPWSTHDPLPPAFERRWRSRLERSSLAHFGFDPAWLIWNATHGHHALAVLLEEGGRAGAMVLREEPDGLTCGWPWRSHAVLEDEGAPLAPSLTPEEGAWFRAAAERLAGQRRLKCYLPGRPGGAGFHAGTTCLNSLAPSEAELLKGLRQDKRRKIRKATEQGYTVVEADSLEQFRAFAELQRETDARRDTSSGEPLEDSPESGESWREWELPWMKLLVAVKDGRVEAGSGFGFLAGGTLDYRTNASSELGKKDGANILLGWEGLRRGRERGFKWLNWAGATRFKLDHGARPVEMGCVLGGGWAWAVPNQVTTSLHLARPRLAELVRSLRARAPGGGHEPAPGHARGH